MKTLERGIKQMELDDGRLVVFYYANNAGRGGDNCTIQVLPAGAIRAAYSRQNRTVLAETRTSAWAGRVNFSAVVRAALGL